MEPPCPSPCPPLFAAWRQALHAGYSWKALRGDLAAGLTVGIIVIPLAMALAIAVGVAPQHGLYTVLIGAPLIAFCGGSRFNISGPTAAFVVILLPISQQHGLGGLLLAAGIFIKRMSDLTDSEALPKQGHQDLSALPEHVLVYAIRGPLFFGAAEKALSVLRRFTPGVRVLIVEMSAVPLLDMTALAALDNVLRDYR